MAEAFVELSLDDRRDALGVAADGTGRPVHLLEKHVRVVLPSSLLRPGKAAGSGAENSPNSLVQICRATSDFSALAATNVLKPWRRIVVAAPQTLRV